MDSKEIKERMLAEKKVLTFKEWAVLLNVPRQRVHNLAVKDSEVNSLVKRQRLKPQGKMPLSLFQETLDKVFAKKGPLTIAEWASELNLSPSQTRSIFCKHKLERYQLLEAEKYFEHINTKLQALVHLLPFKSYRALARALDVEASVVINLKERLQLEVGKELVVTDFDEKIRMVKNYPNEFTLEEWAEKLEMPLTRIGDFMYYHEIMPHVKRVPNDVKNAKKGHTLRNTLHPLP